MYVRKSKRRRRVKNKVAVFVERKSDVISSTNEPTPTGDAPVLIGNHKAKGLLSRYLSVHVSSRRAVKRHVFCLNGPSGVGKTEMVTYELSRLRNVMIIAIAQIQDMDINSWRACLQSLHFRVDKCILFIDDLFSCLSKPKIEIFKSHLVSTHAWRTPTIITSNATFGRDRKTLLMACSVVHMYRPYEADVITYLMKHRGATSSYAKRVARVAKGDMRQANSIIHDFKCNGNKGIHNTTLRQLGSFDWAKKVFDPSPINWNEMEITLSEHVVHQNYLTMYGDGYMQTESRNMTVMSTIADCASAMSTANIFPVTLKHLYGPIAMWTVKTHREKRSYGRIDLSCPFRVRCMPGLRTSLLQKLTGSRIQTMNANLAITIFRRRLLAYKPSVRLEKIRTLNLTPSEQVLMESYTTL